ncbi:Peptide-N4-(N-acetyl-beta-glucosaminyl)asparagine amidase A [Mycena indigotica]|uniref:Peptide-N4-(N-acetyl-beta-glucosaminyl)asparagine amidase A n=1 Tax=Mycena indigotica TaxID=2126181 RepID=A0A8H6S8R9_9AGAR|nr:Peptide-N4-(N-acetyl-beta-glucosaminyl)asparagine amidase A [Mycena indigotica]KAF7294928.1 Peptide-N4-(N-acetyl-beta-glucosaminyl)asparagine amidase A [Mycena indigotica]
MRLSLAFLFSVALSTVNAVLVDFQVAQPPPVPQDAKQCTIQILQRDFAFSFGLAEVVQFAPPTDCGEPGSWAAITLNFTVTSNGTQFDRLGIFTFQNVESALADFDTGADTNWDHMDASSYIKDVTRFTPLFAKPGTFILQLDNLIQTGLDGIYSTTLHATFYASSPAHPPAKKANQIIPLSTLSNTTGNDASVPPSFSINVTLPQNAVAIYAEIIPSGNGNEEFWYFNVANEFLPELPSGTLGQGPFREVRLLVDGQVAGVAFPYPVVFTGGFSPPLWRPITSYGAVDLPTYFIDVTPFVPILTDGLPHTFTLDVASAEADHTILQNWFVSGALQVVTDSSSKRTTGKILSYQAEPFAISSNTGSVDSSNGDIHITVSATRKIHISSEIISGSGKKTLVNWDQQLTYSNQQDYLNDTLVQNLFQSTTGSSLSTHNGVPTVKDQASFPVTINFTALNPSGSFFFTRFDHSYNRNLLPGIFLGSTIAERQIAAGFFNISSAGNSGNGTSNNTFSYVDTQGNTFQRRVNAAFNNITLDIQSGSLASKAKTGAIDGEAPNGAQASFAGARLPSGRSHGH